MVKSKKQKNGRKGKSISLADPQPLIEVDPNTIIHASKPLAEFVEWQNSLLAIPGTQLYRVRKWGDPLMVAQGGYSTKLLGTKSKSNFQAVKLWSPEGGWGGVTNFLRIPQEEMLRLAAMQIEDEFEARAAKAASNTKKAPDWRGIKMSWLCKFRGTIYMTRSHSGSWQTIPFTCWGTIALGGNLVTIEPGIETITLKLPNESSKRQVPMARLKGFVKSNWGRSLDDLLAAGLVHRCFSAYQGNKFGDSPKGIVYSPFFSAQGWDFPGKKKPKVFYIPFQWLEPKAA